MYDGTGGPPLRVDVVISNGRIESVGDAAASPGAVIDASGLAVAPGFFDFHSHADFTIPGHAGAVNSISQGVTTEVVGNCGFSPAPVAAGGPNRVAYTSSCAGLGPDLDWGWSTFAGFLTELDRVRPPVNCAPLVGHHAVRCAVMGFDDRPPSAGETAEMQGLVTEAMDAGAWGLSSGLVYTPGTYADVDELGDLASVAARRAGIYSSHVRNEGAGVVAAVEEAIEIGRRSGATVQVSHLKATGAENVGLVHEAFAALDAARAEGIACYCDVYPYTAGSTFLAALTPGWAQEGGFGELVRRLDSAEVRERIRHEMVNGIPGWNSLYRAVGDFDGILISSVSNRSLAGHEGRSVADLAAAAGSDPFDFVFDLLVEDGGGTFMVAFLMDEVDVHDVLRYPWSVIGSDQLLVTSNDRKIHPRAYGSYVRVLGPLVRDAGLFPLEVAVHKMSGLPASILGMSDRGRIAPGTVADLVLFDPAAVSDAADYARPATLATGVELVLIGGKTAFEDGRAATPGLGNVLRRQD